MIWLLNPREVTTLMNPIRSTVLSGCLALLGFTACSTSSSHNDSHADSHAHGSSASTTPRATGPAASVDPHKAFRDLEVASKLYDDVFATQDAARAEALLATEYQLTDLYGKVTKKAEWIAKAKAARGGSASKSEGREVRVYGNMGIVTGRWHETTTTPPTVLQYTTVFIHRDGRWQVLVDHATAITR